jgi:hypothetical protein
MQALVQGKVWSVSDSSLAHRKSEVRGQGSADLQQMPSGRKIYKIISSSGAHREGPQAEQHSQRLGQSAEASRTASRLMSTAGMRGVTKDQGLNVIAGVGDPWGHQGRTPWGAAPAR